MLRLAILFAAIASASAFAPSALPMGSARSVKAVGPSMQLYKAGEAQGKGVNAIPIFKRPDSLKGMLP